MIKEIEYEERVMLSKDQYQKVVNDNNFPSFLIKNYYFDFDNQLENKKIVLRIRTINDKNPILQMKTKGINGDEELHLPLTDTEFNNALKDGLFLKEEMLSVAQISDKLFLKASLETKRIEIQKEDHLLVIDENHYFNVVDYDLEIEAKSMIEAQKIITKYCDQYSLEYKKEYLSKSKRVFLLLK